MLFRSLAEIRSIEGAKCAVLETVIEGQSKASGMSMLLKGQLVVGPEFFEPLSDEECGIDDEPGAA